MRKPRDIDAELRALNDKAKALRERKLVQLGELAVATGADALPVDMLAGALLAASDTKDAATREAWRKRGAAFFQRKARSVAGGDGHSVGGSTASGGSAQPAAVDPGAA